MTEDETRLYIRPLGSDLRPSDLRDLFERVGPVIDVRLMRGYGFVQFRDSSDARKAVEEMNGRDFDGQELFVEFSRPRRSIDDRDRDRRDRFDRRDYRDSRDPRDHRDYHEPREPRLIATHRLRVSDLPPDASWQDLKDFVRTAEVVVAYTDVSRARDGTGVVDFTSREDMEKALNTLKDLEFKGTKIHLEEDERGPPKYRPRPAYNPRGPPPPRGGYGDRPWDRRDRWDSRDRRDYRDSHDRRFPPRDRYDHRDRYERYDRYDRDRDHRSSRDYRPRDDRDAAGNEDGAASRGPDDRAEREQDRSERAAERASERSRTYEHERERSRSPPRAPEPVEEPSW